MYDPRERMNFSVKIHTAFCTCGWWQLFTSEREALAATDRHREQTHEPGDRNLIVPDPAPWSTELGIMDS